MNEIDLSHLLNEAGEAVVYVDEHWVVQFCNEVYLQNLGMRRGEVIGKRPMDYQPLFQRSIFYDCIEQCRRDRIPTSKIGYSTVLDRWLMVRVFPAGPGMMMLANDASVSVVKQYQLAQQAVKDSLTGLPNKIALLQDIEDLMSRKTDFALCLIGLDRFTALNDALGYVGGDMGLLEIASRLQTATLTSEQLYRINGDEFGLLFRNGGEGVEARLTHLLKEVSRPLVLLGQRFEMGASAGCVERAEQCVDAEHAMKRAALSLRHSKKTCRGGAVMYEAGLESASQRRAHLESELRAAIEGNQLLLHLQPKGCLATGRLVGAEALIRWVHPQRGLIAPAEFLPLALECGLMASVDQLVLNQALVQIRELTAQGLMIPVSINLSMDSLSDVAFVDRVRDALCEANVSPQLLEVEIPEGTLMHDVDASAKVLAGLNEMGVRISIDDFGTGYSSFSYLARFPVHALKIDRSFVKEIVTSDASFQIVKGMVQLAHALRMQVIAEGAEGAAEIELLTKMQCDVVQGYGYGRPMAMSNFIAFAQKQKDVVGPSPYTI